MVTPETKKLAEDKLRESILDILKDAVSGDWYVTVGEIDANVRVAKDGSIQAWTLDESEQEHILATIRLMSVVSAIQPLDL